ncbi:L,D-transpeptidase family protein [Oceanicola sp. 502str15]|uniref:L,D-transpeptidase family protein n=1 Tax=Rhodobacterales TaxID=204455 RepID=UPI002095A1E8
MKKLTRRAALFGATALALAGCSSKFKTYNGPEVTRIVVYKDRRRMYLLHHQDVLKEYKIGLGFAPRGHKQFEGDGKTPEGRYTIDRRNPNSSFHLSIGISYPNERDRAYAAEQGKKPGGDIFIHGARESKRDRKGSDWTAGCIWVKNREIENIYAMVRDGTPIDIHP